MAESSLKEMIAFFGMTSSELVKSWKSLTDKDKSDLKKGFEDGSLTY